MTTTALMHSTPTRIIKDAPYLTDIAFFHGDEAAHDAIMRSVTAAAHVLIEHPGFIAVNVLRSTDGSRVCLYLQWQDGVSLRTAHAAIAPHLDALQNSGTLQNSAQLRTYTVVYTDDRSADGVSVIAPAYTGAIFINEITTMPATQDRLLDLVIANNERQSFATPGYRSANFHKSDDGARAMNYSLWDTEAHCIDAISRMADMDENLEETVQIANPDFRFYMLVFAAHA